MKLRKRNYVYSVQISKDQNKLLKNNPNLKQHLNNMIKDYINLFIEIDKNDELNNKKIG